MYEEITVLRVGVALRQKTWVLSGTLMPVNLSSPASQAREGEDGDDR